MIKKLNGIPIDIVPYLEEEQNLPTVGQYLLGQHKQETFLVYAAFKHSIANSALTEQQFISGCGFKYSRYCWLKPSFLWLMHRSEWAKKKDQERILAMNVNVEVFEALLKNAINSHYDSVLYADKLEWKNKLKDSNAIFQFDPDYSAQDKRLARRALQLGLRSVLLKAFNEAIVGIYDLTDFAREQYQFVQNGSYSKLLVPKMTIYQPKSMTVRLNLKLDW